jgi:hypothetical protein
MFKDSLKSLFVIFAKGRHDFEAKVVNADNLTLFFSINTDIIFKVVCAVKVCCKLKQAFCKFDPILAYLLKKGLLLKSQNATYILSIDLLKITIEILIYEQN